MRRFKGDSEIKKK